jgi:hypothetical protein
MLGTPTFLGNPEDLMTPMAPYLLIPITRLLCGFLSLGGEGVLGEKSVDGDKFKTSSSTLSLSGLSWMFVSILHRARGR